MAEPTIPIIQKVLQGIVRLNSAEGTKYNLVLSENNSGIQSSISPITVEEIFIECDTTLNSIEISLPTTAKFKGGWSPKIFITNINNADNENGVSFYANGQICVIKKNSTAYLHIVKNYRFAYWSNIKQSANIPTENVPPSTNIVLKGFQDLQAVRNYNIQLPSSISPTQTDLSHYNLEECFINFKYEEESLSKTVFVLPPISSLGGDRSIKIYITNDSTIPSSIYVRGYYSVEPLGIIDDKIDGTLTGFPYVGVEIETLQSGWFQVVSNGNWAFFRANPIG
jgi:hypothetical protein